MRCGLRASVLAEHWFDVTVARQRRGPPDTQTLDYFHRLSGGAWERAYVDTSAQIMGPASLALDAGAKP